MTKADNTELATIRRHVASWLGYTGQYASTLLHLLDEAIAERDAIRRDYADTVECLTNERGIAARIIRERDAAMAALREIAGTAHLCAEPGGFVVSGRVMNNVRDVLAAHSAATEPTEVQE